MSGAKDVFKDQKEGGGGGGYYWPVPAVWRSGGADPEFHQNGVYLSHLAALVFSGKKIATKVPDPGRNPKPTLDSTYTPSRIQPLTLPYLAALGGFRQDDRHQGGQAVDLAPPCLLG